MLVQALPVSAQALQQAALPKQTAGQCELSTKLPLPVQALQVSPQALQQAMLLKHHQQLLAQHVQAQASGTLNAQRAQTTNLLRFSVSALT